MKYIKSIAVAAGLACAAATSQAGITLQYSSLGNGAAIDFAGGSFTFDNATSGAGIGNSFSVTSAIGTPAPVGDSAGDFGKISGSFAIGTIDGTGNFAPVTGTGTLTITDGTGALTAQVVWNNIQQNSANGGLNINGQINLSTVVYTGTKSDLHALANVGAGIESLSFSFTPPIPTLANLKAGGITDSYSGNITSTSPVPEPTTVIAGALLLLPFGLSTLRIIRKNSSATVA
jgi:hypothetical protein